MKGLDTDCCKRGGQLNVGVGWKTNCWGGRLDGRAAASPSAAVVMAVLGIAIVVWNGVDSGNGRGSSFRSRGGVKS
eukprot:6466304-Amphidinium_carterae.2